MSIKKETEVKAAFFRAVDVCNYLSIKRTSLHEIYHTDTTFPRKINLSKRLVGWRKTDIDAWLDAKATGERTGGGEDE